MGLSTYGQLKAAVADWMERSDLTERTGDFIALSESRLNRTLRARCLESDQTLTATPGSRSVSLPPGFREALGLWLETATGRCALIFRDPADMEVGKAPGPPRFWGLDGDRLVFDRPCDRAYTLTLRMLGRLALSDSQPVNGVLTDYPDLYLFGALVEAAPYLRDADMLGLFAARFDAALTEARIKEGRSHTLAALRLEPAVLGEGRP